MKRTKTHATTQLLHIAVRITYRLESTHEVVEQQEQTLPVPVDDGIINGILEEALLTG